MSIVFVCLPYCMLIQFTHTNKHFYILKQKWCKIRLLDFRWTFKTSNRARVLGPTYVKETHRGTMWRIYMMDQTLASWRAVRRIFTFDVHLWINNETWQFINPPNKGSFPRFQVLYMALVNQHYQQSVINYSTQFKLTVKPVSREYHNLNWPLNQWAENILKILAPFIPNNT